MVNASDGTIMQRMDYDEHGNVTGDTNPGFQPFGFAGGLTDQDAGFVRFGARDYDPEIGCWLGRDPIGFEGGDGNLYAYCGGNPVDCVDPSGLDWIDNAANFAAGFGDTLTFDLTARFRRAVGSDGVVNRNSGWYTGGVGTGIAWGVAFSGAGAASGAAKAGARGLRGELYEIGQKTLSKSKYEYFAARNANPIKRGIDIVRQQGWIRAKLPSPTGILTQGWKTVGTGLTPAAAAGLRDAAAVGYGALVAGHGTADLLEE